MLEIVLATTNLGKLREFQESLSSLPVKLIPQSEFNIPSVEETATTFVENALIKARHACAFTSLPVIADDSGLVVEALKGAPGVRSARYAGEHADDNARIKKLLSELDNAATKSRSASFRCVTVLLLNAQDPTPYICEGVWNGVILPKPVGNQGFGYDPIFHVAESNCSAAELSVEQKNKISHRGQALCQLLSVLQALC